MDPTEHISRVLTGGIFLDVPILHDDVARFFVQTVFIIAICRGLSIVAYPLKQPSVIFEIIGGILLGPSAFGRNDYYLEKMFPKKSLTGLSLVANIGLVLYLFMVGLELDPKLLITHAKKAGGIAIIGMAVPFALGIAISSTLFHYLQADDPKYADVSKTSFFVFIGTAMSITAFPVLARMLKENGLIYTRAGSMAMGAAALNDAVAWCLLILAVSMANSGDMSVAGKVFACVFSFGVGLFVIVRPILGKLVNYLETLNNPVIDGHLFALALCMCMLCAWTTDLLGVDPIFGAFMFGLTVPRDTRLFHTCENKVEQFVLTYTLPLYFALSGLKTDVTQIKTGHEGAMVVLVCVIASVGKFVGAGGTAFFGGSSIRESGAIAVLMNTRGLVELIVLNLGLQSGILNVRTFTVMVLMALFTTFITSPLVDLVYPERFRTRHAAGADEKAPHGKYDHVTNGDNSDDTNKESATGFDSLYNEARLGLVVDRLEDMQVLIKVLACFLPFNPESGLAVTVMHFIEPTHSKHDEFLALNEEGRLIRVDEETTDMAVAIKDSYDPALKKPELLPVSMFCKGMSAQVNAFRIQGDPDEFPLELKTLIRHNEARLVVVPWRDCPYLQNFFWSSVDMLFNTALVLMVTKDPVAAAARGRSNSAAASGRVRGNSIFQKLSFGPIESADDLEAGGGGGVQMYSNIVERSARRPTISHALPKLPVATRHSPSIVAVLTGHDADVTTLVILRRCSQNRSNQIHLMLPKDYAAFSDIIQSALTAFKAATEDLPNVHIETVDAISTDIERLVADVYDALPDYFVCSYIEQSTATTASHAAAGDHHQNEQTPPGSYNKASSMGEVVLPRRIRDTTLPHPEMGILGSALYCSNYSSRPVQLLIVHHGGAAGNTERKLSNGQVMQEHLSGSDSAPVATIASAEPVGKLTAIGL